MCPVCGYAMQDEPRNCNICPSCGTEFGVSDVNASFEQLRLAWILGGANWWSTTEPRPANWNAAIQLAAILNRGITVHYEIAEVQTMAAGATTSSASTINHELVDQAA